MIQDYYEMSGEKAKVKKGRSKGRSGKNKKDGGGLEKGNEKDRLHVSRLLVSMFVWLSPGTDCHCLSYLLFKFCF